MAGDIIFFSIDLLVIPQIGSFTDVDVVGDADFDLETSNLNGRGCFLTCICPVFQIIYNNVFGRWMSARKKKKIIPSKLPSSRFAMY